MTEHAELIAPGTLRIRRLLPAPVERVWAFLTEADKRARWLAGGSFELRPGGGAEFHFDNAALSEPDDAPPEKYADYAGPVRFEGKVLVSEPPHRLVLQWPLPDGEPSEVTFELEARGDGTLLTLTETNLGDREHLLGTAAGWHSHLDILDARLAGTPPPSFWSLHTRTEAEYDRRFPGGG